MAESRHSPKKRIAPPPITAGVSAADLVDGAMLAYNGGRLREAARLLAGKALAEEVVVGLSLSGALTPAGLGMSCIVPLIEAGFVDWMTTTGANLYHDLHLALDYPMFRGSPFADDKRLKDEGLVRIYDVIFEFGDMMEVDREVRESAGRLDRCRPLSSAAFHHHLGGEIHRRAGEQKDRRPSVLEAAYLYDVPVFAPSPGDSALAMNAAELALRQEGMTLFDVLLDVNQTAAIVYEAKRSGGKTAVVILGGGAPKNFLLQTEPYIQEILGLEEEGHDYFVQVTDARPDSGGLSGATPSEAVSWGKIDPQALADTVVCYADTTIALPLLTAYLLTRAQPRQPKRLYRRLEEMTARMKEDYLRRQSGGGK